MLSAKEYIEQPSKILSVLESIYSKKVVQGGAFSCLTDELGMYSTRVNKGEPITNEFFQRAKLYLGVRGINPPTLALKSAIQSDLTDSENIEIIKNIFCVEEGKFELCNLDRDSLWYLAERIIENNTEELEEIVFGYKR
jgi:hypothetical protein